MHFTHERYSGMWLGTGCPTPQAFEQWDAKQSKALNGDGGGSWAPTSPIVIGGAGLTAANPITFSAIASIATDSGATLTFPGAVSLFGATTITGAVTFQSGATQRWQAGALGVVATGSTWTWNSGSTLTLSGSFLGTLEFQSGFVGTAQSGSSISLAGTTSVGGTLAHTTNTWSLASTPLTYANTATVTRSIPEIVSGTAAITAWRYGGTTGDFNTAFDVSADTRNVKPPEADRTYILLHSGAFGSVAAAPGHRMRFDLISPFLTGASCKKITFTREDGSVVAVSPDTYPWFVEFEYRFSEWHVLAWGVGTGSWGNLS